MVRLLLCLGIFAIVSCSAPPPPVVKPLTIDNSPSLENSVFHPIKGTLSSRYFDIRKCPKIGVVFNSPAEEIPGKPYLGSYLVARFTSYAEKANQLKIVDPLQEDARSIIETQLSQNQENTFTLNYRVLDAVSLEPLSEGEQTFPLDSIDTDLYTQVANRIEAERAHREKFGNTHMLVRCFTDGDSFKASDNYYLLAFRNRTSTKLLLVQEKGGTSGYYPTNIQISVDGDMFSKLSDDVVFDQEIPPGRHVIDVYFQEGSWDSAYRRERAGKTHSGKFLIDITKDDNVVFDVLCNYDGEASSISVKAVRRNTIVRNGKRTETAAPLKVVRQ